MKSTQEMRDRIRELMNGEQDDYDRAVECVLDDLEGILGVAQAWQAVETAPHETLVLLGWWYDGVWFSEVGAASHGWRRNGISNMSRHGQATHWQPLPDGPVVSSTHCATLPTEGGSQ